MDDVWARAFVSEALRIKAAAIHVIGGFPSKGFSCARGASRENMKNKDSILFWELKRVIDLVREMAGTDIPVRHVVEHVLMDRDPEDRISEDMGGRPTKIPVCACNRDRIFWIGFTITPLEGGNDWNTNAKFETNSP